MAQKHEACRFCAMRQRALRTARGNRLIKGQRARAACAMQCASIRLQRFLGSDERLVAGDATESTVRRKNNNRAANRAGLIAVLAPDVRVNVRARTEVGLEFDFE
jgi:hypothetical protein